MKNEPQGLRLTTQRKVILEELRKVDTHPTADEVYEMVRKRLPRISLGTVYRNLETLSEHGSILKLERAGAQKRFDGNPNPHHHVRCVYCGRVGDVRHAPDTSGLEAGVESDFEIIGHSLEFVGVCPWCRAERFEKTGKAQ
ncbi:MAG: transcriptional repressor [Thermodesulfobacteriota bacterium]|nr:transcriptional repressor [Thermodesulfobacteriota bacterium]